MKFKFVDQTGPDVGCECNDLSLTRRKKYGVEIESVAEAGWLKEGPVYTGMI